MRGQAGQAVSESLPAGQSRRVGLECGDVGVGDRDAGLGGQVAVAARLSPSTRSLIWRPVKPWLFSSFTELTPVDLGLVGAYEKGLPLTPEQDAALALLGTVRTSPQTEHL